MSGLIEPWDDTYTNIWEHLAAEYNGHTINPAKARRFAEHLHERTGIPHRVTTATTKRTTYYLVQPYEIDNDDPNV